MRRALRLFDYMFSDSEQNEKVGEQEEAVSKPIDQYILGPYEFFREATVELVGLVFACPLTYASYSPKQLTRKILEIFSEVYRGLQTNDCCEEILRKYFPEANIGNLVMLFQCRPPFSNTKELEAYMERLSSEFVGEMIQRRFEECDGELPFVYELNQEFRRIRVYVFKCYAWINKPPPVITKTLCKFNLGLIKRNFVYLNRYIVIPEHLRKKFIESYDYVDEGLVRYEAIVSRIDRQGHSQDTVITFK